MNLKLGFILLLILFISCADKQGFPLKKSQRFTTDNTSVKFENIRENAGFSELFTFVTSYKTADKGFSLAEFENEYQRFVLNGNVDLTDSLISACWIEMNGLLLELTGKEIYAQALEQVSEISSGAEKVQPFVFTKNVDHIYVNIFKPAEIGYSHTLGGEVRLRQETDYPESGKVTLFFEMTERRYIELYIRIPDWAEGTNVEVKKVKYFTQPGTYCKIAKKWKQGDVVEIQLPIENYPAPRL
ncbi:hypothetical protein [uncultured Draconibacterium sp.]|uniref:hypothetical protein n=1 Tax=uncultured Draconibacterium sp. TaxID=1573823 RepID=UPI0032612175